MYLTQNIGKAPMLTSALSLVQSVFPISYDSSFYRRQGAGGALTDITYVDSKPYVNRMIQPCYV